MPIELPRRTADRVGRPGDRRHRDDHATAPRAGVRTARGIPFTEPLGAERRRLATGQLPGVRAVVDRRANEGRAECTAGPFRTAPPPRDWQSLLAGDARRREVAAVDDAAREYRAADASPGGPDEVVIRHLGRVAMQELRAYSPRMRGPHRRAADAAVMDATRRARMADGLATDPQLSEPLAIAIVMHRDSNPSR